MLLSAGLLVLGGALSALTISNDGVRGTALPARRSHCAVDGPPLHADQR